MAETERSLIPKRVRAGLRNTKAKGKQLGRPRKALDVARVAEPRESGLSWRKIRGRGYVDAFNEAHELNAERLKRLQGPQKVRYALREAAGSLN